MNFFSPELLQPLSRKLIDLNWKLVTAESCTAGGLAFALTSLPGSSAWFERGFVTYSNLSKQQLLLVKEQTLATYGAVSEQVVSEMAEGALQQSEGQISIAITGIAGPDGGSSSKPVGTVWIGIKSITSPIQSFLFQFAGDRHAIREQSIDGALKLALDFLS